jgi:hypothetical protein
LHDRKPQKKAPQRESIFQKQCSYQKHKNWQIPTGAAGQVERTGYGNFKAPLLCFNGGTMEIPDQRRWSRAFFLIRTVGGGVQLGPIGTTATNRPIVPTTGYYDAGEIGGMMIGKGNRSTRRKPAPVPLCPPQNPHASRMRTRAAGVGSQRLTA